jgi:CO/xanthine dehydrogenase Mo-binding subunit
MFQYEGRNQDRKEFKVVGRRDIPGRLAYVIATGKAMFSPDVVVPDMLHGKFLRSPYAHARIRSIDTSKAQALPGVRAVITWEDPEVKAMPRWMGMGDIKYGAPMLGNVADLEGDEVGAVVAAESEELCEEALRLLKIDWEELPQYTDPLEAMKPGAAALQPELTPQSNVFQTSKYDIGNVDEAFKKADHVVEYDSNFPQWGLHHPNPATGVAWWEQDQVGSEGPTLFITGLYPSEDDTKLWDIYKIPIDKIHRLSSYQGGKYCDFIYRRCVFLAPLLAKRTGRPVRVADNRRDQFATVSGQRSVHVKLGFNDDGMITACQDRLILNMGTRPTSTAKWGRAGSWLRTTKCSNVRGEGHNIWTNTARSGLGPDNPYAWQLLTIAITKVANELGMDPIEVTLKNVSPSINQLEQCIEVGKKAINWDQKWHAPGTKKLSNGKMHGISFRYHTIGRGGGNIYACTVNIKADGKVYMPLKGPWRGLFAEDAAAMVVAEELGARPEDVFLDYDPLAMYTCVGGGSAGGTEGPWVAKEAAIDCKKVLLEVAAAKLRVAPDELDIKDSRIYLKADPSKNYGFGGFCNSSEDMARDIAATFTGKPLPPSVMMNGVFCEVEVDTETGQVEITNFVAAVDCGKALRPSSTEGQIDSQLIMTVGACMLEEMIYDKTSGVLLNGSTLEYKPPTILDIPTMNPILLESRTGTSCYKSGGVSHCIMERGMVACAVHNAIGKWIEDVPITPDKVLKALGKI